MELHDLLQRPERWASVLRWATLAGLELGAIGPFGSYKANFFSRMIYWTVLFWAGSLVLWPSVVAAMIWGPRKGLPPLFSGTTAVLLACVPLAALAAAGCYVFWPVHASGIRAVEWYGLTAMVVLPAVAALLWLELALGRPRPAMIGVAADDISVAQPTGRPAEIVTGQRLPDHLVELALCLQMEDHHVRVHTIGRSHLHLSALSIAMHDMGRRRGLQVHRSWWVAENAVRSWLQDGRSVTLVLTNGLRVPVARHRIAMLRSAGWLDDATRLEAPIA